MSSGKASRRRGDNYERAVASWLRGHGFPRAERRPRVSTARPDVGDIDGVPGWIIDPKDRQKITLAAYLDQLEQELDNAFHLTGITHRGIVIAKRAGTADVGRHYAIQTVEQWANGL